MFVAPRKNVAVPQKTDRLMRELGRVEGVLQRWIGASPENAQMFQKDPIGAMRAAGIDIEDDLLCELETIMNGIARKLGR